MHIESINIKEFRGIKKLSSPIKFNKYNVIVGRNNSGKSALLDALSLLPFPDATIGTDKYTFFNESKLNFVRRRYDRPDSVLYGYVGESTIDYIFNKKQITFNIKPYNLDTEVIYQEQRMKLNNEQKNAILIDMNISISESGSYVLYIPYTKELIDKISKIITQDNCKNLIIKEKIHMNIMKTLITKYVDDNFTEFLFTPELELRKEYSDKSSSYVSLKDMGTGVQKISILGLWIELMNPKVILIDDIETFIHPSMLKGFMSWLKNKDIQVIMVTHSIDVLNIISDIGDNDTNVIQVEKNTDDILSHNIITFDSLINLFDANVDPRLLSEKLSL